jgi:hypothetical protein
MEILPKTQLSRHQKLLFDWRFQNLGAETYLGDLCGLSTHETMSRMGAVSRAIDQLAPPVRIVFLCLGVAACVYGFAHYGWSFILRVIFSADL